jgi:pyruvate/2-oxoglutarate dehydrogenase complex dihydrolipoamide acyltransferase (E2) component
VLAFEDGMLVPVSHAAAGLTLRALARRVADVRARTTTRQLTTDDLMGATFTIAGAPTNHVLFSVPVLIQPQVAIVSVGAPRREVVAVADSTQVADRVVLGCAFDHRAVEATYVARFLDRVAELLAGLDVDSER